jgi:hypothetical protein
MDRCANEAMSITTDGSFNKQDIVTELLPIVYPKSVNDEIQYLYELNAIATTLPLYSVAYNGQSIQALIDSGASENYVSPHIITHLNQDQLIPVPNRQVETAGGIVAEIKYKVKMSLNLNGMVAMVTAFVFPTKFDLILGRSWLKQAQPLPDWSTDTWYLKNGSIKLKPCINAQKQTLPKLNYLISHKQADRYMKKGAESFLFYIKANQEELVRNPGLQDDSY